MPLDSRIALGVETPKAPDLLQSVGQLMSIKGAMQENALRQVQTQHAVSQMKTAQLEQEQKQRDVADEQTFQSTLAKNGGSFPKTFDELQRTAAISPTALLNKQSKFAETVKNRSLESKETLLAHNESLKSLGGSVSGILLLPAGEQDAAYQDFRARALADPSTAKEAAQLSTDWNKDRAQSWKWMGNASTTINDEAIKLKDADTRAAVEKRATDKFAVDLREATAKAAEAEKVNAGMSSTGVTAAQQLTAENSVTEPKLAKESARAQLGTGATEGQVADLARKLMTKDKIAARPVTNIMMPAKDAAGNVIVSSTAKLAAEGRLDPATLRAIIRRQPAIVSEILQANPQWDEKEIEKQFLVGKDFASTSTTKAGGQVIALNTVVHHADLYLQAAEALKNGSFKPGNAAYNKIAEMFGSAPPQNAALIARFLASETGKVATGGVPAEGEIKGVLANLGNDASPDQIAGAGRTLLQIASGRATPLMEKVKDAKLEKVYPIFGPDAKEILTRRGFDPETMKPVTSGPPGGGAKPTYKAGDTVMYQGKQHKVKSINANGKLVLED